MILDNKILKYFDSIRELSEICGIHAGDGYLRNDGMRKELDISGSYDEKEYYDTHVIPLFSKAFSLEIEGRFFPHRHTYGFVIRDGNIIRFMHEKIGFPYGQKSLVVDVPDFIKQDATLIPYFLRGYFDTDGCLAFSKKYGFYSEFKRQRHFYPRLIFSTVSLNLSQSLKEIFQSLGFKFTSYTYQPKRMNENLRYRIDISGNTSLNTWLRLVGIKNSSKYSRLLVWKKFGFCPPNTNFELRQNILKGEINPVSLY
jgi:hypothetical protein